MTRDEAIEKLLLKVQQAVLVQQVNVKAAEQPFNYSLQLLNAAFQIPSADPNKNWFTALGVLCINQRFFSGELLQTACTLSGNPPMTAMAKKELIDAIASGSKLTKADAG